MKRILTIFLIALLPMMAMSQNPITRPGKKPQKVTTHPNRAGGKTKRDNKGRSNRNKARHTVSQPTGTIEGHGYVDLGVSKPTPAPPAKPLTGTINGYECVDLGLSVKWATKNVGASSPSDYGDHFAWGETETKKRYYWDTYFDCLDDEGRSWGIYKIGGKTSISPTSGHDTARENWGGSWRMPTDAEFEELCDETKCEWTWTSQGGHEGYKVTGPNGNSIFLPAAGWGFYGTDGYRVGENGCYWSSTLSSSDSNLARRLGFVCNHHYTDGGGLRGYGLSVRPVTE